MAYDEGLAQLMRDDLAELDGITEKKMFGGIAFLHHGNMVCGVHSGGGMFRVGKDREAAAKTVDGAGDMMFTGKKMGGMVDVTDEALANGTARGTLMRLALEHALSLPPK
jgi:TfoX/Sxy family transcriptional regulator of competence genes